MIFQSIQFKHVMLTLIAAVAMAMTLAWTFRVTEMDIVTHGSTPSMRGVCWVAGDSVATHNFAQITDIGVNWISQTPFGWMNGHESPEVHGNFDRAWWGETDKGICHTTVLAQEAGVKTMLKPHIWLRSEEGKWRPDIEMKSAAEWDQWFASYREWIMHYAIVAEECDIEALCIGTELHQTTKQHPDRWRAIIKDIREVYKGDLTYAANWYKEVEEVTFWDDLDYIGVQAYFPLSKKIPAKKKDLLSAWKKHKKQLAQIGKKYNRKIVFTEVGYKNTADAAHEPWTWPQQLAADKVTVSEETQRICYDAMFESLWHEQWFDGMFIWKWFHSTHKHDNFDEYFATWDDRRAQRAKERGRDIGPSVYFTPQRTGTIKTIEKWYTGAGK